MNPRDWDRLDRLFEGTLPQSEQRDLSAELEANEEFRREAWTLWRQEAQLRHLHSPPKGGSTFQDKILQRIQEEASSAKRRLSPTVPPTPPPGLRIRARRRAAFVRRSSRAPFVAVAASVAAAAALLLFLVLPKQEETSSASPGRVARTKLESTPAATPPREVTPVPEAAKEEPPVKRETETPPKREEPAPPPIETPQPEPELVPPPVEPEPDPSVIEEPQPRKATAVEVASIECSTGDVFWADGKKVASGESVKSGASLRTGAEATASIVYPDGTRVDMGGETECAYSDEIEIVVGRVAVRAAKRDKVKPLILSTTQAVVRVTGTELYLRAEPGSTRVDVVDGKVELRRRADGSTVVVTKGKSASTADAKMRAVPIESLGIPVVPSTWKAVSLTSRKGVEVNGHLSMYEQGEAWTEAYFPRGGEYEFRIRAMGKPSAGEWPRMEVRIDGKTVGAVFVDSDQWSWYALRGPVPAGPHRIGIWYTNDDEIRDLYLLTVEVVPAR